DHAAYAAHHAPADVANDVNLVRCLQVDGAAALVGHQLVGHAGAVYQVRVVPRMDHAQLAQLAAAHDLAHEPNRRLRHLGVALHQPHAVALGSIDHRLAFLDGQGHRL